MPRGGLAGDQAGYITPVVRAIDDRGCLSLNCDFCLGRSAEQTAYRRGFPIHAPAYCGVKQRIPGGLLQSSSPQGSAGFAAGRLFQGSGGGGESSGITPSPPPSSPTWL